MSETLRIAVQKSGRLYEGSMKLLKECGIEVSNGNNQLRVIAANFPVEIFFLRDDDIPEYVQDAVADIGFVGENVVKEKNKEVDTIEKLGFGKCRLSIAIHKTGALQSINDLNGKKIAFSAYGDVYSASNCFSASFIQNFFGSGFISEEMKNDAAAKLSD